MSPLHPPPLSRLRKLRGCSLTSMTEPIYTSFAVLLEEGQGLSRPGSLGFQNSTYPEAVCNIMGLGSTHYKQFILLIDFTSLLIVFILKLVAFPLLQYVFLSGLAWHIGGFTAVICTGLYHRGNMVRLGWYSNMTSWILRTSCQVFAICGHIVLYKETLEPNIQCNNRPNAVIYPQYVEAGQRAS